MNGYIYNIITTHLKLKFESTETKISTQLIEFLMQLVKNNSIASSQREEYVSLGKWLSQLNFYCFIPVCNKSPLKLCSSCIKPIHTTSDNNAKYEWATTFAAHLDKYCTEWNNSLEFHHILHSRVGKFIEVFMFLTVNTKKKKKKKTPSLECIWFGFKSRQASCNSIT